MSFGITALGGRTHHKVRTARECRMSPLSSTVAPGRVAPVQGSLRIMAAMLSYLAAAIIGLWGLAHVVPTRQVVAGFGNLSVANRRVLLQEWLAEAIALWAFAALVIVVTAVGRDTAAAQWVDRLVAVALVVLAGLTGLTGARTPTIWFKICPVLLTGSAALLFVSSFL